MDDLTKFQTLVMLEGDENGKNVSNLAWKQEIRNTILI